MKLELGGVKQLSQVTPNRHFEKIKLHPGPQTQSSVFH